MHVYTHIMLVPFWLKSLLTNFLRRCRLPDLSLMCARSLQSVGSEAGNVGGQLADIRRQSMEDAWKMSGLETEARGRRNNKLRWPRASAVPASSTALSTRNSSCAVIMSPTLPVRVVTAYALEAATTARSHQGGYWHLHTNFKAARLSLSQNGNIIYQGECRHLAHMYLGHVLAKHMKRRGTFK